MSDAQPGDVYADETGKLWRVIGICPEPSVYVQEIEWDRKTRTEKPVMMNGGISGQMWLGFKRIFRPK